MIPYDFFRLLYCYFILLPFSFVFVSIPLLIKAHPFPPFRLLDDLYPAMFLSTTSPPPRMDPFNFSGFCSTPGYILTSEDLQLRTSDEIECPIFVF